MPRKFVYYNKTKRPKLEYPENMTDYIEYEVHQEKKSTGPGVDDFEIIDVEEERRVNIDEFINSFNDKAGIESVLRIFNQTADISVFNQTEAIHADLSVIPDDPEEAFKLANGSAEDLFKAFDPELTNGESMEDFIKNLTPEKLKAYIEKKVKEKTQHEDNETIK